MFDRYELSPAVNPEYVLLTRITDTMIFTSYLHENMLPVALPLHHSYTLTLRNGFTRERFARIMKLPPISD
ncbi:MAG: hypothetical protein AAF846_11125 [Chloroflexota bacterium]